MSDAPERIWWSPANGRLDTSEPEAWYTAKMPTYEYVRADLFAVLEAESKDLTLARDNGEGAIRTLKQLNRDILADLAALEAAKEGWYNTTVEARKINAALEDEIKRLLWMWEIAENLDPALVEGVERQRAALEEGGDDE